MAAKPKVIGKITHVYGNLGVGVLELKSALKVGEEITIKRGDQEFTQTVDSLQIDHENVPKAGKGQDVGIKLAEGIKEGALVMKA